MVQKERVTELLAVLRTDAERDLCYAQAAIDAHCISYHVEMAAERTAFESSKPKVKPPSQVLKDRLDPQNIGRLVINWGYTAVDEGLDSAGLIFHVATPLRAHYEHMARIGPRLRRLAELYAELAKVNTRLNSLRDGETRVLVERILGLAEESTP